MLVLTRKVGEAIRVGDVLITVVDIRGGRVRIGIDAPESVAIVRTELGPLSERNAFRKAWAAQCPPGDDPAAWSLDHNERGCVQ